MRVAVTGAGGRLGRAVLAALNDAPFTGPGGATGWTRSEFDLDAPMRITELIARDRPEAIVHCAAWTDVDGCARDPELAHARNALATQVLAEAAAARGVDLVVDLDERGLRRPPDRRRRLRRHGRDLAAQSIRCVEARRRAGRAPGL